MRGFRFVGLGQLRPCCHMFSFQGVGAWGHPKLSTAPTAQRSCSLVQLFNRLVLAQAPAQTKEKPRLLALLCWCSGCPLAKTAVRIAQACGNDVRASPESPRNSDITPCIVGTLGALNNRIGYIRLYLQHDCHCKGIS